MNTPTLKRLTLRHGTLVRDRLVPTHLSLAGWYRAHESGLLTRLHPGVARLSAAPVTPMLRIESALAACLPNAAAGGLTAAWLWGAESAASNEVELLAPPYRHPGRLDGVEIHRPTDEPYPRVVGVKGIRACDPLRATLDIAAWHPERLDAVMAELVIAGRYGIGALRTTLAEERRRGRPGVTALQAALDDWRLGERPPDSMLERTMGRLLARHHLPEAEFQRPLAGYRPDFTFVAEMALLECDGWGTHGRTRRQFESDRQRDAELGARGWVVWRYSWRQIVRHERWVARTLRDQLAARRAQLGLPPEAALARAS
jgi:very-short-patch-repair endonuclease